MKSFDHALHNFGQLQAPEARLWALYQRDQIVQLLKVLGNRFSKK